jgi:hypothetical protein
VREAWEGDMKYVWRGFVVVLACWLALPYVVPGSLTWRNSPIYPAIWAHPVSRLQHQTIVCAETQRGFYVGMPGYDGALGEQRRRAAHACFNWSSRLPATSEHHAYTMRLERAWLALGDGHAEEALDQLVILARSGYREHWSYTPGGGMHPDIDWRNAINAARAADDPAIVLAVGLEALVAFEGDAFHDEFVTGQVDRYTWMHRGYEQFGGGGAREGAGIELNIQYANRLNGMRFEIADLLIDAGEYSRAETVLDRARQQVIPVDALFENDVSARQYRDLMIIRAELALALATGRTADAIAAADILHETGGPTGSGSPVWSPRYRPYELINALDQLGMCDQLTVRIRRMREPRASRSLPRDAYNFSRDECPLASLMGDTEAAAEACQLREESWAALLADPTYDSAYYLPAELTPPPATLSCFADGVD